MDLTLTVLKLPAGKVGMESQLVVGFNPANIKSTKCNY